jgi:hypothetical protein
MKANSCNSTISEAHLGHTEDFRFAKDLATWQCMGIPANINYISWYVHIIYKIIQIQ